MVFHKLLQGVWKRRARGADEEGIDFQTELRLTTGGSTIVKQCISHPYGFEPRFVADIHDRRRSRLRLHNTIYARLSNASEPHFLPWLLSISKAHFDDPRGWHSFAPYLEADLCWQHWESATNTLL